MNETIDNFECLGKDCPNHCCASFNGISNRISSMDGKSFSEIILLPEDTEKIKANGHTELIVKGKDGIDRIKTAPDGTCSALKNGLCSIYESRPSICKAFPLYLDLYAGVCFDNSCPAFKPGIGIESCRNALESLLKVYRFWIEYYDYAKGEK